MRFPLKIFLMMSVLVLVVSCSSYPKVVTKSAQPNNTSTLPPSPGTGTGFSATTLIPTRSAPHFTATITTMDSATLWLDPILPADLRAKVQKGANVRQVEDADQADLVLSILKPGERAEIGLDWIYVIAARFPTVVDGITTAELGLIWAGDRTRNFLLLDPETLAIFSKIWGEPTGSAVVVLPKEELLQTAWEEPDAFALIPFGDVEPRWKVLSVDGLNPMEKAMDTRLYPLSLKVGIRLHQGVVEQLRFVKLPESNRLAEKIISLDMTGVTALVRGTARTMNERGVLFPAKDIENVLSTADLTHISNEVSFNPDCSPERAASPEAIFCSAPEYIQLLEAIGADIIELTGNHNLDKGETAYHYTMGLYADRGWLTFGGGRNLEEARRALVVERGTTRLALIGCNWAGPDIAWATLDRPGAAPCDIKLLVDSVTAYKQDGYLPVVTFQAFEIQDYMPAPVQRPTDYWRVAEAGAVIVSGSQAHFPQGFRFEGSNFIHYGLGNLFFDQMQPPATRKAFIDQHFFYENKYLGVELITIKLEDASRPRLMNTDERAVFLQRVFDESGWSSMP